MNLSLTLAASVFISATIVCAEEIADGDAALQDFNLEKAVHAYRAVCAHNPDNFEATWKLCRGLVDQATLTKDRTEQRKLIVEAEQLARKAVSLSPTEAKGHVYLAIAVGKLALYEGGKKKVELSREVKVEAEKAMALNREEDLAYHVLGVWHREMVELNWLLRTFAEFLYGKFPEASLDSSISNLQRAVELAPDTIPHRVELGVTLASARKWSEANTALNRALGMPKRWVTDEYYWSIAKQTQQSVKPHLD